MLKQPAIHLNTGKKLLAASRLNRPPFGIPSFAAELRALEELGIARLDESGGGAPRLVRTVLHDTDESRKLGYALAGNELLDRQLTELLFHDFRKQNIVAWSPIPDSATEQYFNDQWFSAHAFSKLRPVMRYEKGKPPVSCATVFDVRAGIAELADVEAFLARIRRAGDRPGSNLRILGVMGARYFEPDAFGLGKEQGLILINFQQAIGDEALEALAAVDRILSLAPGEAPQGKQPDYGDLFQKLRHHPQVKAIAGLAFESLAACVLQADGWTDAKTGLSVPFGQTSREIDVCVRRGDRFLLVECKAYAAKKDLPHDDILKFFTETVPAFRKDMASVRPVRELSAELWTTGKVTADNRATLNHIREKFSDVEMAIKSAAEITIPNDIKSSRALLEGLGHL